MDSDSVSSGRAQDEQGSQIVPQWDSEADIFGEAEDGTYCACDLEPTLDESDWGTCGCCGKPLY